MNNLKSKRMTLTARCDCPWVGYVRCFRQNESWIVMDQHNHRPSLNKLLPSNRCLHRQNDLCRWLDQLSRVQRLNAEDVARQLKKEFPESSLVGWGIYSWRFVTKSAIYEGRTATQQFVMEPQEQELPGEAYFDYHTERSLPDGPLKYVFWI